MAQTMSSLQLQHECDAWFRALAYMKDENVHLKNRLAELMQTNINKNVLDQAEDLQNSFINKDMIIALLKSDISEHDKVLGRLMGPEGVLTAKMLKDHKTFRADIEKMEKEYIRLKVDFNSYTDRFIKLDL